MLLHKILNILKRHFLSGVIVVVPFILTYIVIKFLFESVDGLLQPLILKLFGYSVPGLGLVTTILLIILAGIFTRNIIGAKLYRLGDYFLVRMPIIRPIYSAAKQLLEALTQPSMNSFKEVVLVEYPRKGSYTISFLSNKFEIESKGEHVSVFVPSTPTPISGMVIIVPKDDIIVLDMTIEEGVKFLVSGGVASPTLIKRKIIFENKEVQS